MHTPVALTIAGSDPSGGAGLQADLKTFHQHGVYGMAVVTLLTVQNTQSVDDVVILSDDLVGRQIDAVLADIPPAAVKTGALGDASVVRAVAARAAHLACPLVVDPVMISKHGARLIADDACGALVHALLPHAALVTPNLHEAAALSGLTRIDTIDDMQHAARIIAERCGARAVLVKGGHLDGDATDILLTAAGDIHALHAPRIHTTSLHGTGCTLSAAITARLAQGHDIVHAVHDAKDFLTRAIASAPALGRGAGPLNHFARS